MFDLNKEHTSLILPILPDTAGGSRKSCKRVKTHFLILIFIVFFKKIKFLTFKMSDMKEYFWSRIFKKSVAQFVLYWNGIEYKVFVKFSVEDFPHRSHAAFNAPRLYSNCLLNGFY